MQEINGETKVIGLLGSGIAHTLSPRIHNFSAHRLNINHVYVPFDFKEAFPSKEFFDFMWDANAVGFNVTVPWKQEAARYFAEGQLKSVNTIYRSEKGWKAASTDGEGFALGLTELSLKLQDFESIVYLGDGGAALGLFEYFETQLLKVKHTVLRRSPKRDSLWLSCSNNTVEIKDFAPFQLQEVLKRYPHSLLIQCTSAPLHGDDLKIFAEVLEFFPGAYVDLVYGKKSALLDKARELNVKAQDGLPMLVGQAIRAQNYWWQKSMGFLEVLEYVRSEVP